MNSIPDDDLLLATKGLAVKSCAVEAELLVHLGEVDARKLYAGLGHPSMFAYCTRELGFSESAASNRIVVARAARRLPAMLGAASAGKVHLTGLRLLAPHLTPDNCDGVLASAAGKTKDEILELVARLAPRPPVETMVRKLPAPRDLSLGAPCQPRHEPAIAPIQPRHETMVASPRAATQPQVMPLADDLYRIQLSAPRAFKDKLKHAQDLSGPGADVLSVLSAALDLLLERKLKDRIGAGKTESAAVESKSRYIPAAIRRVVWERDEGRCAFIGSGGTRCTETRSLEFDHVEGFARTHRHDPKGMRLLCRAHNQHAANELYGGEFMERRRRS